MQQIYKLPLVLDPQPEGGYTITCPLLPGLVTEADKVDEIIPNVTDAFQALMEAYEEQGRPLPRNIQRIDPDYPFMIDVLLTI